MSNFLKIIQEATPDTDSPSNNEGELTSPPNTPVKKGGLLQKVAAGAAKATAVIKKGEQISQGNWDIAGELQKILNAQLDSSTKKLGMFGKTGFKKIKLGSDIIEKINQYGASAAADSAELASNEVQSDEIPPTDEANESFNSVFIHKINEAFADLDKDAKGQYKNREQMAGNEDGKSDKEKVWSVLKSVLGLDTEMKLTDPDTGKKVFDRRIDMISKRVPGFLKDVKEVYPDIPFTYEAHDKKTGLSGSPVLAKKAAAAAEQEEEFNYMETTPREWVKSLGEEKVEEIVRGLVNIYLGDKIVFEEPASEDGPEDEPGQEDGPVSEITEDIAIFELTAPTGYGDKGTQYTLKPLTTEVDSMLKQKDIKYLTYLNSTPQNEFKTPETNTGIIYAYDNNNAPIASITTESAKFQWDGQEKLYTISTDNEELMGTKFSEGQFPIKETEAEYITPDGKYFIYKNADGNLAKWPIVTKKSADGIYTVDKNKPQAITEKDKNDMLKADGSTPSKDIISKLKVGDVVAVTLASDNDNSARIVTIVSNDDKALTVNDHNKPKSSNYSMTKDNIKDIAYFKK